MTARSIDPAGLVGHARGEIELDGTVLVIKRIAVTYTGVQVPPDKQETAQRALETHHRACPVSRTLAGCIDFAFAWGDDPTG